jgi:Holliday junction resolvase RusA-like endonuclease
MQPEPFFSVRVEGAPVPKGRPRVTKTGHVYTPGPTRVYEIAIQLATRAAMKGRKPTEQPVVVHVAAIFEPPASLSKKKKRELIAGEVHAIKPDLDNLVKAALDGISGETMAIANDSQITEICAFKRYGDRACLMIDVFEIKSEDESEDESENENPVDRFTTRWRSWQREDIVVAPV